MIMTLEGNMNNIITALKLYLVACLCLALFSPRGEKEGYVMDVANSFGYYTGKGIRTAYDYSFGLVF